MGKVWAWVSSVGSEPVVFRGWRWVGAKDSDSSVGMREGLLFQAL